MLRTLAQLESITTKLRDNTCVSNADVASSSKRMSGFLTNALAIAIRCF